MDIKLADHLSYKHKILEKKLLENLYVHKRNPDLETKPSSQLEKYD